jgi:hypothetical protein
MELHVATPAQFKASIDSQNARARAGGCGLWKIIAQGPSADSYQVVLRTMRQNF